MGAGLEEWKFGDSKTFYFRLEQVNPLPMLGKKDKYIHSLIQKAVSHQAPVTEFYIQITERGNRKDQYRQVAHSQLDKSKNC